MSKQPKSHLKRITAFDYINSAVLLLIAVCCVYPFLYVFFVATTDGTYLARGEMTFAVRFLADKWGRGASVYGDGGGVGVGCASWNRSGCCAARRRPVGRRPLAF